MYIINDEGVIRELVDPAIVPWLSTNPQSIILQAGHTSGTLTSTLGISSTAYPIAWKAEFSSPVDWATLPVTHGVTPGSLEIEILLDRLEWHSYPYGIGIQISSEEDVAVNEPIFASLIVFVGSRVYLPVIRR